MPKRQHIFLNFFQAFEIPTHASKKTAARATTASCTQALPAVLNPAGVMHYWRASLEVPPCSERLPW